MYNNVQVQQLKEEEEKKNEHSYFSYFTVFFPFSLSDSLDDGAAGRWIVKKKNMWLDFISCLVRGNWYFFCSTYDINVWIYIAIERNIQSVVLNATWQKHEIRTVSETVELIWTIALMVGWNWK